MQCSVCRSSRVDLCRSSHFPADVQNASCFHVQKFLLLEFTQHAHFVHMLMCSAGCVFIYSIVQEFMCSFMQELLCSLDLTEFHAEPITGDHASEKRCHGVECKNALVTAR